MFTTFINGRQLRPSYVSYLSMRPNDWSIDINEVLPFCSLMTDDFLKFVNKRWPYHLSQRLMYKVHDYISYMIVDFTEDGTLEYPKKTLGTQERSNQLRKRHLRKPHTKLRLSFSLVRGTTR